MKTERNSVCRKFGRVNGTLAAVLAGVVLAGGCQSGAPVAEQSAVELAGGAGGTAQLSVGGEAAQRFFDLLPEQPLATNDDLLFGLLLIYSGTSPADFAARRSAAEEKHLIAGDGFAEARRVVTVGEAATAFSRALSLGTLETAGETDSMEELVSDGVLPAGLRRTDAMTGTQLSEALGKVWGALASAGVVAGKPAALSGAKTEGKPEPKPEPSPFDAYTPTTATPPAPNAAAGAPAAQPAATKPATTAFGGPRPTVRPEPLPEVPTEAGAPKPGEPGAGGPAAPAGSAPSAPASTPWVPGKPLGPMKPASPSKPKG